MEEKVTSLIAVDGQPRLNAISDLKGKTGFMTALHESKAVIKDHNELMTWHHIQHKKKRLPDSLHAENVQSDKPPNLSECLLDV